MMIDAMKHPRLVLCACLLAAAWTGAVSAQTFQAQITGVIRDPSGAVIPNAKVVATNIATRVAYSAQSNDQGIYRLLALPPAQYKLTTSLAGFKTSEQGPITLQVNDVLQVEVNLRSEEHTSELQSLRHLVC